MEWREKFDSKTSHLSLLLAKGKVKLAKTTISAKHEAIIPFQIIICSKLLPSRNAAIWNWHDKNIKYQWINMLSFIQMAVDRMWGKLGAHSVCGKHSMPRDVTHFRIWHLHSIFIQSTIDPGGLVQFEWEANRKKKKIWLRALEPWLPQYYRRHVAASAVFHLLFIFPLTLSYRFEFLVHHFFVVAAFIPWS